MKALSLDVGPSRFMVAEGNLVGQEVQLEKLFPLDLPMGSVADGSIADQASIRSALEVMLKANKVRTRNTIVTVSSNAMIIRRLEVPHASEKDTKNLVNVEMQQYLPSGKKFMVDYISLGEGVSPNGGKMNVVKAAALPSELCDGYYRLLQSMRLKPYMLSIHPQVLSKLFAPDVRVNNQTIGSQALVVVELSQYQIVVSVIINGEVDLARVLPIGISNLERTVADRMQTSPEEARLFIRGSLDFQRDTTEEAEAARRFLSQVLQELRKVQQYLRTKNLKESAPVYLYGVGSGFKGLDAYLAEQLEAETDTIRAHGRINMPPNDKSSQLAHYLNAAGALLNA
jgi:type IV pilus assembly protein PilM